MPADPYAPCPGGTGKKIKFCCPDLTSDLDKLERMMQAEQRAGALDHIELLLKKYPDRACLFAYKTMLETELKGVETSAATAARFLELYPENPVALAELAISEVGSDRVMAGVATLQRAMQAVDDQDFPHQLYSAIGIVAEGLLREGHILGGRGHLLLQLGLSQGKDNAVMTLLGKINSHPSIPLLLKQDVTLVDLQAASQWPTDPTAKKACDAAMELAFRGSWIKAAEQLGQLAERAGPWPGILRNLAILRGWLADEAGACTAWRACAASPHSALDDAVEAEAIAQLLDPLSIDQTDVVRMRYPVANFEQLQARLVAHQQTPRMPFDLGQLGAENQPPPKGAFFVLDRPMLATAANLSHRDVPRIVGQAILFSRETDRDARLELITYGGEREAAHHAITLAAGDALNPAYEEEVANHVPTTQHLLSWNWRLPDDTKPDQRLDLMAAERREALLEGWPNLPLAVLGGQTALAAAPDPANRIRLLAATLLIELGSDSEVSKFDFNELRSKLGLPASGPVDPTQYPDGAVPLARLTRVAMDKLDDAALFDNFDRAQHFRHVTALRRFALEMVSRASVTGAQKAVAYGVLGQTEVDTRKAIEYVGEARKAAESVGRSSAPWDLTELSMRIAQNDIAEAEALMQHIKSQHINEQGVAEALFRVLVEAGVIGPDGMPAAPAPSSSAAPTLVVPGGAPASGDASGGSKLWTPGAEPAGGAKKSAIWTPGS